MAITSRYKDLSLTFRAHPITGDITKLFDEDAVKESIINLVLTMNYEVPFHPELGCSVVESLFDPVSPMTAIKIRKSIIEVLQNFESRIEILDVQIFPSLDENGYSARIIYRIVNRPVPIQVEFFLEKKR